ncbi:MAG: 5-(carboxyamino)imidazole ribonucleotide synthase [Proteobacteria bacterium]|jgi:5-(carboxyamino)imidazole ribonucleotide synthase|nr:5-(carboxyamino)imidazole ribonucleotide synthase [Pseudomonadota bacterium]
MKIGILGGGQLAMMMAQAGKRMGHTFTFLDPSPDACAFEYGDKIVAAYDNVRALEKLALSSDVVTFEFENVPSKSVEILSRYVRIQPTAAALAHSQNRLKEKKLFNQLFIPTNRFSAVNSIHDLEKACKTLGFPIVLKTVSQGYDGKGQYVLRTENDIDIAWNNLGNSPLIAEAWVAFDREISMIGVRNQKGDMRFYSVCENVHRNGILHVTHNKPNDPQEKQAQALVARIMDYFQYVGVMTLEMFQRGDELIANEIAPRVHNSGHWTIEGAQVSQFENHLRAILDLPLGSTKDKGFSGMVNCIGQLPEKTPNSKNIYFHDYKKAPRPGRKIGHITLQASSTKEVQALVDRLN